MTASTASLGPRFGDGPPDPPCLRIERCIVERRAGGVLFRKPYRRTVIGEESELVDGGWQRCEPVSLKLVHDC